MTHVTGDKANVTGDMTHVTGDMTCIIGDMTHKFKVTFTTLAVRPPL